MFSKYKIAAALLVGLCLSGCNGSGPAKINASSPSAILSPLAGKWTGKSVMKDEGVDGIANILAGSPLTGPSSLTMNANGTGFMKVADTPEQPISWKQEGDKIIFEGRSIRGKPDQSQKSESFSPCVGTLSSKSKSMKIDMGKVQVTLEKQKSG